MMIDNFITYEYHNLLGTVVHRIVYLGISSDMRVNILWRFKLASTSIKCKKI